jgi:RNA polymerase sigma-70 factor (ECF subfamily)
MFGRRRARKQGGMELALGHLDALYGFALTLTQDANDAADLVHDTYLCGERAVRRLTDRQACKAVLYQMLLRLWRQTRQHAPHEVRLLDPADDPSWALPGAGRGGLRGDDDPEATMRPHAFVVAVDRALAKLPPDLRVVVLLAALEGYTSQEMADLLGCPPATVQARLHQARHWLAQDLTAYTDPLEEEGTPA